MQYSQSPAFGQAPYPAPSGYPYQPQPPPVLAPPPPQPFYRDPASFRHDYMARLGELTFNCRPIIQNLSMIAQDYTRWADIVSQCLQTHIRRVPPWMKLPAFYVLDAISKNVFEPYARLFASFITSLFLEAYEQVDQATRSKMIEMLLTWRTGAPNGKELFGMIPQIAIERGVWGESTHGTDPTSNFYSGSGQISKSQVLSELEFTLGQKQRALQANPYDTLSQTHVSVLDQLRKLVETGVSQDELRQILGQLRTLTRSTAPPPPPPQHAIPPPASSHPYSAPNPSYDGFGEQPPNSSNGIRPSYSAAGPSYPQPSPAYPSFQPKLEPSTLLPVPPSSIPPSTHGHSGSPPVNNISQILAALAKAGVVTATPPPGSGPPAKAEDVKPQVTADPVRESSREYRSAILSQNIKLTSTDITKKRPPIVHFLFDRLPIQCKQCGIRFADTSEGKKDMEGHLDMHFRQNRKANQNIGRGHSRSWFVGLDDWIHDTSADVKGKGRADGSRPLNAKAAAAAEAAKHDAELRALHVVVPPGDEAKPVSCPICKEILKSEFLEDDEDWVWKNAIMKDDRVYHATCHAEAVASTNNLAARLRNETLRRSRSGSPEASSQRGTPPKSVPTSASGLKSELRMDESDSAATSLSGTKRKADDDGDDGGAEVDGSPAAKKQAMSASAA
ncbi:hypothetical protein PLICRDRAFT_33902 [Plicaturopsis crispa FD-325 SS-3]|nr:hypothetical protein PLICRDRAFT_33902 [Plicaturopsis crispa FD-325 SS-3]